MIILYQYPGVWGLPNASPFCLKIETYLRMAEIPYEIRFMMNPAKAPKGKLPFIKIDDETIADSELIIEYLIRKFGDLLDRELTREQKAETFLLDNLFAERLYWIMLYLRWQDEQGWSSLCDSFFPRLPRLAKLFVPGQVRKQVKRALYAQGMGRHSYDEVLSMGNKTLDVIAQRLAQKRYFHGSELTGIDATAFAFLANIAWLPHEDALKKQLQQHDNLLDYCDRIWGAFYSEMTKPFDICC
ncbi:MULTISPECIES: glutathione S-transferase family protein [unclassified Legionella]|uniref:glutathione S-transferase family protein n=1 Tax=unclassified Legionella TaxID=2622702 RepID=UPI0013EFA2DE|nr:MULTISPECIES: glutathione S-transferase family protein [unclassified Legionella]MDI9817569.1 glutathione S-transferase family protein [Legionella sp. PL877]